MAAYFISVILLLQANNYNDSIRYIEAYNSIISDSNLTKFIDKEQNHIKPDNICFSDSVFNLGNVYFIYEILDEEFGYLDSAARRDMQFTILSPEFAKIDSNKNEKDSEYPIMIKNKNSKNCLLKIFFSVIENNRLRATAVNCENCSDNYYEAEPESRYHIEFLIYFDGNKVRKTYYKLFE